MQSKPKVGIFSTGDEVVASESKDVDPGKIRDSNKAMLISMLLPFSCEVADLGVITDD